MLGQGAGDALPLFWNSRLISTARRSGQFASLNYLEYVDRLHIQFVQPDRKHTATR